MTAHVVARAETPRPVVVLECLHCGARVTIALPVELNELRALCIDFDKRHEFCKRKDGAS